MLLQTNSYIVPKEKRAEHSRIIRRFRQTLIRLGCGHFEVYEQVGVNWTHADGGGRYVQILRFDDKKHQLAVQTAERTDPTAQAVIAEFCELINFPYQQQQGLFAVGFYTSALPALQQRGAHGDSPSTDDQDVLEDSEPSAVLEEPSEQDALTNAPVEEAQIEPHTELPTQPETHAGAGISDDEFEDLSVDDLEESGESGGFLVDEIEDEKPINGVKPDSDTSNSSHPAHAHKAKNRPMNW